MIEFCALFSPICVVNHQKHGIKQLLLVRIAKQILVILVLSCGSHPPPVKKNLHAGGMNTGDRTYRIILTLLLLAAIVTYIVFQLLPTVYQQPKIQVALIPYKSILYTIYITGGLFAIIKLVGYKPTWQAVTLPRRWYYMLTGLVLVFVYLVVFFFITTNTFYAYTKGNTKGEGHLFTSDSLLGYRLLPNQTGYAYISNGYGICDTIQVSTNSLGNRIAAETDTPNIHTNLFLGCSFTFGSANKAEETYPHYLSVMLHSNYENAGLSNYGLCQMLLKYQQLTGEKKFDYVFAQYSPWLIDRSIERHRSILFGYRPFPYVAKKGNQCYVHPPLFNSSMYDVPFDYYKHSPTSIPDRLSFFYQVGIPVIAIDNIKRAYYDIAVALQLYPAPCQNKYEVADYIYSSLDSLCRANNSQLVIVKFSAPDTIATSIATNRHLLLADADKDLNAKAGEEPFSEKRYNYLYRHTLVKENDTIVYDRHYNAHANRIIAASVYQTLKQITGNNQR